MITYSTDTRAQRLHQFLAAYVRENPRWAYTGNQWGWPAELRTVEDVAAEMLGAIGFREVQLTQVFESPDGQ
ncbi:MAG: hypothetical protein ACRDU4_16890, partial [Mycobacterium sp.]